MKLQQQQQLPFTAFRQSPNPSKGPFRSVKSTEKQHLHKIKSKSRHHGNSTHQNDPFQYCHQEIATHRNKIHSKSHKQRSISSSSQSLMKPDHRHCCQRKRQLIQSQIIKEEYNLNNVDYKRPQDHQSSKTKLSNQHRHPPQCCQFDLHNCKYITHYITKMQNQLSSQKQKNKILKRRNKLLQKQNQTFNEYFQQFQDKYSQLIRKAEKLLSRDSKDIYTTPNSKPHQKHHSPNSPYFNHNKIFKLSHLHQAQQENDNINEYSDLRYETERIKKQSCVTDSSSRKNSRQNFRASRFDEMYSIKR